MTQVASRGAARQKRHDRIRLRLEGDGARPRLAVFRSLKHISAQVIDDSSGRTLAAATSLPNAYAAVRLAMDGRGAAVVSATFNSNTLNLVAGIAVPILLFPSLRGSVPAGYIVWLLVLSLLALALVARGLRRRGAVLLLGAYAGFVVYAVLTV